MPKSFEIDLGKFAEMIEKAPEVVAKAARLGMHDVLDEWKAESVDVAPIDKGTLRQTITIEQIQGNGLDLSGGISANATVRSKSGRRFNYAYYIHELDAEGKSLRTPGTEKQFLDEPAKRNEEKWVSDIEREVESELKEAGW